MAGRSNELLGLFRHSRAEGPPHKTPTARPPPAARVNAANSIWSFGPNSSKENLTAFRRSAPDAPCFGEFRRLPVAHGRAA